MLLQFLFFLYHISIFLLSILDFSTDRNNLVNEFHPPRKLEKTLKIERGILNDLTLSRAQESVRDI